MLEILRQRVPVDGATVGCSLTLIHDDAVRLEARTSTLTRAYLARFNTA